ncbi:uncharacterized protein PAC_15777 [Phialocephala subalpina]|uniref:Uncharacterized protein n=1 Tax=Phialocephala subalpina TaxID=576137 RepID=A0A1L7XLQ6_9HELO|nr:uncharacterized protein PAC_15777 [Phialocephala subalpina]
MASTGLGGGLPRCRNGKQQGELIPKLMDEYLLGSLPASRAGTQKSLAIIPYPLVGDVEERKSLPGPTNFSAVFLENSSNLDNNDIQISNDSKPYMASYESLQSQTSFMLAGKELQGSPRVALGAKVLSAIPDQQTCRFLLNWNQEKDRMCYFPKESYVALANSLWTTYARQLAELRHLEDLEAMSSILSKNAETGLEDTIVARMGSFLFYAAE